MIFGKHQDRVIIERPVDDKQNKQANSAYAIIL